MNRIVASVLLYSTICLSAFRPASALTIDTVPIGNPGNSNDPATDNLYGSVNYFYRIGKYDVTVGQYAAFLNAVATANDKYKLYDFRMASDLNVAGISQSVASGSFHYSVIGSTNHPITYVSWADAARFANWLNNEQPVGTEGPGTTETGAYTLNGTISGFTLGIIQRNADARWFIPSENEWYKAAYYDPIAGHYWSYATRTSALPASAPPGSAANAANYFDSTGAFAVTGSASYNSSQNYLTDVGAYTNSASAYGTFDQSGNVDQWTDTSKGQTYRILRGGDWIGNMYSISSSNRQDFHSPLSEYNYFGFRVAMVPEPSTGALAIVAGGVMYSFRKRFAQLKTKWCLLSPANAGVRRPALEARLPRRAWLAGGR